MLEQEPCYKLSVKLSDNSANRISANYTLLDSKVYYKVLNQFSNDLKQIVQIQKMNLRKERSKNVLT